MRMSRSIAIVAMAIVTMLSFGAATSFAQATPTPPPAGAPTTPQSGQGVPYPVAMHAGTCEAPTPEPEVNLENTTVAGAGAEEGEIIGQNPGPPALVSVSAVDLPLADLGASPRIIAVHTSPDEFGTLVACGTIAGTLVDGQMVIALQPVQDSGVSGVALLSEDDGQTNIVVYLSSPDAVPATPAA